MSAGATVNELYLLVSGTGEVVYSLPVWASSIASSSCDGGGGSASASIDSDVAVPMDVGLFAAYSPLTAHTAAPRRVVREGALLGEAAFFTEVPQLEAVRAVGMCRVLVLARSACSALERAYPGAAR